MPLYVNKNDHNRYLITIKRNGREVDLTTASSVHAALTHRTEGVVIGPVACTNTGLANFANGLVDILIHDASGVITNATSYNLEIKVVTDGESVRYVTKSTVEGKATHIP